MRVGILTGGGDCPGLNAVIRGVVRRGEGQYGHTSWDTATGGAVCSKDSRWTCRENSVRGLLPRGGTILGTSRTNPYKTDDGPRRVLSTLKRDRIDALIAIGGEDTLGVANKLSHDGVRVGRRPQDHRQRPFGDRLHVRVPHRGADRDRRDRPPAHDRREPRPRHGRGGHGPARGMDRHLLGARRVAPTSSSFPRSRSTSKRSATRSATATSAVRTSRSS